MNSELAIRTLGRGPKELLKAHWPYLLSSSYTYLTIVLFSRTEEEAKSEANKRAHFPPLGLRECRESR